MQNKKIQVAIAGFGMSGKIFHAPFLHADERFAIKRVYERATERAKEEYPYVEVVRDFSALLRDDIDLVVISTPNQTHVPFAKEALTAGKNVVVEKPMAATAAEAAALCALAREKGVLLSVYQNRRLDGDFLTVKQLIEAGRLGEVLHYEAHFDRFVTGKSAKRWKAEGGNGVDILYDLGVHIIDQAYALFGMPKEVYADLRKQREESAGIDNFAVILYYDTLRAILSAGEVVAQPGPHYMVHGRKASFLKYGMDVQEQALVGGARPPMVDWGEDAPAGYGMLYTPQNGVVQAETIKTCKGDYGGYYDNLYAALTANAAPLVQPEEAVAVLRIIEAAQQSDAEKRRIAL
ncbi:MAG: Gfo/Idh/MocA family oxidoreductase [Clostridia bacterium]|nr:Gfo/Idh/MocA family oxidoreductase [Clostridia bacterium]